MGISVPQLIVVLIVLVLLFGTGRLRTLGEDLGTALKAFRKALGDGGSREGEAPAQDSHRLPGHSGPPPGASAASAPGERASAAGGQARSDDASKS